MNTVRFCSYNCNSVRAHFENVRNIMTNCDIIFLQEILLCKSDLPILDELNDDFQKIAYVQDRESAGIIEGRPTRGVAILWRKSLSKYISPLLVDDSVIGIILSNVTSKVLLLNVYMPCDKQTLDALDNYRTMLAKLDVIVKEQNLSNIILTGDFNADPKKGRFWGELKVFMSSFSLYALDEQLPQDTFTYLCPAKSTTSWLDHVLCTNQLRSLVTNIKIDYERALYDHFPLYFNLAFELKHDEKVEDSDRREYVRWNKLTEDDKVNIKVKIDSLLNKYNLLDNELFFCCKIGCKSKRHRKLCDKLFRIMKLVLLEATKDYVAKAKENFKIVPGWNDYIKELYTLARKHFLEWLEKGKPLDGIHMLNMKQSRSNFKYKLEQCRNNEERIRNEKMAQNFRKKRYKEFWHDVNMNKKGKVLTPKVIDGESNPQVVSNKFSKKYKDILDRNKRGVSSAENISIDMNKYDKENSCGRIRKSHVREAIMQLNCTVGDDSIHSNHLKFASNLYVDILTKLLSSFLVHGYIPKDLLEGTITPTIKDRFGCLEDSGNYRPVMSSSVFLKILEYCILFKIRPFIFLNDRQHGYREKYSTNTACFVLKETVLEYCSQNSKVYSCFLDFSKAFDNVSHEILIGKLKNIGVPSLYLDLIKFWYANQYARVRYNGKYSESWKICNGVRHGGVLSGLLFCLYINSLIERISKLSIGCRLGLHSSNIIAYADAIVLLAPSASSLQSMMDIVNEEALKLDLRFNVDKCKILVFMLKKKLDIQKRFFIGSQPVSHIDSIKYLGFYLTHNLSNEEDINSKRNKFYSEYNQILRKFSSVAENVKLFIFKQYCLQVYGAELWFGDRRSKASLKQFAIGYHKAIKKLIGVSYHESNHYACQQAQTLTFEHFLNSLKMQFMLRLNSSPCPFIEKILKYLSVSSVFFREVIDVSADKYQIDDLIENDRQAVVSRVSFVQNHESQMRGPVDVNLNF